MSGFRREWVPGAAVVVGSLFFAGVVGGSFGSRSPTLYVGLAAGALLCYGWLERWWIHRKAMQALAPPKRRKSALRVIRGGRDEPGPDVVDLENEESTRHQRWLM